MTMYAGGSDTASLEASHPPTLTTRWQTASAISMFFALMTAYPEVQEKAHAEITRVIGTDRLPTYSDRSSLPYVEAVYKEVLRWHPIVPIGLPHRLDAKADDEYRGAQLVQLTQPG